MTSPGKPRLDVYVLHNDDDADHDVFHALAVACGAAPRSCFADVESERHAIKLRGDVHREHAVAAAVLVVHDDAGVDLATRLAALHARREGAHRFILLIEPRGGRVALDDVERDARALLDDLGVSGNDVPVVRAPLTRSAGRLSDATRSGMRDLLAALDDLPPLLEPAPPISTPRGLAVEAEILATVLPFCAPATLIASERATLEDTAALRSGAGGSFQGGAPYTDREEAWPLCPLCRRQLGGMLQIDARDVGRDAPPSHGVFVLFTCMNDRCGASEIRHHPLPRPERRRRGPLGGVVLGTDRPTILRPGERCWQLPAEEVFNYEHPELAAHLAGLTRDDDPLVAYARVADALGMSALRIPPHFGGHHHTTVGHLAPACDVCGSRCVLVVQVEAGDHRRCLWACRDHPSAAFHAVHP